MQVIRSVDLLDEPPERRPPPPLIEINPRTPKKRLPSVSAPSTCSREDILKKLPKSTNILASPSLSKRFDSLVMGHPQQSPSPGKNKDPSRGKISLLPCGPPTKECISLNAHLSSMKFGYYVGCRDRPKPVSAEIFCRISNRIFCRNRIVANWHYCVRYYSAAYYSAICRIFGIQ